MIKATHLRSKTGTPIFGKYKGKNNDAVTRDRKIAQELVKFKYTDTIMTEGTIINLTKKSFKLYFDWNYYNKSFKL